MTGLKKFGRIAALGLVGTIVGVLAGCGGGGGGGTPDNSPAPTPSLPSAPSPPINSSLNETACSYQYTLTNLAAAVGADPLLGQQWHLNNTGQSGGTAGEDLRAFPAWTTTRGAGARVAVVDDAIEIIHEDLAPNAVANASRNYRPAGASVYYPLPCTTGDEHGTAVAGLVAAAADNAKGGAGVAPLAQLVGFNPLATNTNADIADALTRDFSVNQVYNNSWGSVDDGRLHPGTDSFRTALKNGLEQGRGGKGSIYVFPGGNGGCYYYITGNPDPSKNGGLDANDNCYNGYGDNSNYDSYVNRMGVIAACAVSDKGKRSWYSERGANLMVCAPSSNLFSNVVTTNVQSGYRTNFSGTSATTPMVSGVVALILAANPSLTWRDVRQVLARSARRNDATDSGWSTTGAPGVSFNHKYGFGVANAQAAVALASTWTSIGGSESLRKCEASMTGGPIAIPDATGVKSSPSVTPITSIATVSAATCSITKIEYVELTLLAPHTYSADLRVRLTSPSTRTSELADARVCVQTDTSGNVQYESDGTTPRLISCGDYGKADGSVPAWTFGSNRHFDESPVGTWLLEVTDMQINDTGTLMNWTVTIYGR